MLKSPTVNVAGRPLTRLFIAFVCLISMSGVTQQTCFLKTLLSYFSTRALSNTEVGQKQMSFISHVSTRPLRSVQEGREETVNLKRRLRMRMRMRECLCWPHHLRSSTPGCGFLRSSEFHAWVWRPLNLPRRLTNNLKTTTARNLDRLWVLMNRMDLMFSRHTQNCPGKVF